MGAPVSYFEILGKDVSALQTFYSDVFDWDIQRVDEDYCVVSTGNESGIEGGIGVRSKGRPEVTFYVTVSDIDATLDQVEAKGGSVLIPRTEIPAGGGHLAFFADPEGHAIGLVE